MTAMVVTLLAVLDQGVPAPAAAGGPLPSAAPVDEAVRREPDTADGAREAAARGADDASAHTNTAGLPLTRIPPEDLPRLEGTAATPLPVARLTESRAGHYQRALVAAHDLSDAHGVTLAIVRDGAVVWAGASGHAQDGHTPLTADSPMVVGSVTKTFVAAAILQLVDEGRLALDDAVTDHLPELTISPRITIRQLLNHTSGLADVFNDTTRLALEEHPETPLSPASVLRTVPRPWYEPGKGYAYANTNYLLLSLIVERTAGAPLADELGRRFIGPLGLDATALISADDAGAALDPAWATIFFGSGAMVSSARDLALWGDGLYGGDVLSGSALDSMLHFHRDDHGLGVQRIEINARVEGYGHSGLLHTYTTLLIHLPEQGVTIAMLVNRSHADVERMLATHPKAGPSVLRLVLDGAASVAAPD